MVNISVRWVSCISTLKATTASISNTLNSISVGPGGKRHKVGEILLATEVMWLEESLVDLFGLDPVSTYLARLPLRIAALVDVAKKAGLANGRTEGGVLLVLREQSATMLRQWKMRNLMTVVPNNAAMPTLNVTTMVSVIVDIQKDCKELKLVRLYTSYDYLFSLF